MQLIADYFLLAMFQQEVLSMMPGHAYLPCVKARVDGLAEQLSLFFAADFVGEVRDMIITASTAHEARDELDVGASAAPSADVSTAAVQHQPAFRFGRRRAAAKCLHSFHDAGQCKSTMIG